MVISRRQYSVPWPNSLWHLDGHHSLIRWGFVIHGCMDGFSRRVVFLRCSNNNLSQTVLELFLKAIEKDGLWPSRIRVDYGVENVLVCDAMVEARGEGRGSFIAGPSTRNQRIERLWRDVFRINLALHEYMEAFNHHKVRTANHWSPYGMLNEDNPLVHGQLDEDPNDLEFYGVDPDGPSPFEDSNNNVVVPPVTLPVEHQSVQAKVLEQIDPFMSSMQMGIDIYTNIHQV
nr:uncharacterized protein LOC131789152 [Pocillopora verrucosa]